MINTKEILSLSREEKILLIEKLWDSLKETQSEIPESQVSETLNRYERVTNGISKLYSLEELRENLRKLR
jgi:putative addiction module component (TIGR02574 family)